MKYKNNIFGIVVFFLIVSMIFLTIPYKDIHAAATTIDTSDAALKRLENDLARVKQQQADNEKKIANAKADLKNEIEQKQMLDRKFELAEESIRIKEELRIEYQNEIRKTEESIAALEIDVSDQYEAVLEQLKYSYQEGSVNYLEIILGAKSFAEFIMSVERVVYLLNYEQKNMERLNDEVEDLQRLKEYNEQLKVRNDEEKDAVEAERAQLLKDMAAADAMITKFLDDQNKAEAAKLQLKKDEEKFDKEIEEFLIERERLKALQNQKKQYGGGLFLWPTDEDKWSEVSSEYGYRSFDRATHTGIDIPVALGGPVFAVADGEVVLASWHGSYGYYIIIDHGTNANGDSISTLYAHNHKLLVKTDDVVKAGDRIANAGSTGVSTGSHIHFEIRINGKTEDPLSNEYFTQYKK
ncbi:MAG: peptidoglycan DD-metalloendopeptidase family protein [Oscillospiraceae bacterium]|nr:peptidoglycan DD-metalloendopeptidase family protein [Oscillospiraceae bacterium]